MTKQVVCPVCNGYGFVSVCGENSIGAYTCDHCNGAGEIEIPMTNADRIRAMSDEELAWELMTWRIETEAKHHGVESNYPNTKTAILEWLKQTAEADNG